MTLNTYLNISLSFPLISQLLSGLPVEYLNAALLKDALISMHLWKRFKNKRIIEKYFTTRKIPCLCYTDVKDVFEVTFQFLCKISVKPEAGLCGFD